MKLIVQKNYLYINENKLPCAIGKNGVTKNKKEGDGCTPFGKYKFNEIYYRADKMGALDLNIESFPISSNDGWCDEPQSQFYNQLIKFPFSQSAEKLYRNDEIYDIVCIINYNTNPVKPGKGSAIFLHVAHEDYRGTQGCIALSKIDLLNVISQITKNTLIDIQD